MPHGESWFTVLFGSLYDSLAHVLDSRFGPSYIEHQRFAHAIRNGLAAEVSLEEGMRCVADGLAAHRSIDTGLPVLLSDVLGNPSRSAMI